MYVIQKIQNILTILNLVILIVICLQHIASIYRSVICLFCTFIFKYSPDSGQKCTYYRQLEAL